MKIETQYFLNIVVPGPIESNTDSGLRPSFPAEPINNRKLTIGLSSPISSQGSVHMPATFLQAALFSQIHYENNGLLL